jgi:formate-dependent nitrite reductase membrane component NrfD
VKSADLAALDPDASGRGVTGGPVLPPHQSDTYYERPLLKRPHWEWNVILYLFLGGIMGGSSSLVLLADEGDEGGRVLARNGRYLGVTLALVCPAILVSHLGRPERFLNMLRIVKLKSPMSVGVWGLFAYGNLAALSAAGQLAGDGLLPEWLGGFVPKALLDPVLAIFGSFIAGYTGVLISATAIPVWAKGKRHIPALSVCSGVASACAAHAALLALEGEFPETAKKLERLELVASLAELAGLEHFRRYAGDIGKPMFEGPRGRKLRTFTQYGGILGATLLNLLPGHSRAKTLAASALTLLGGYVFRETLIEAGKDSADDPRAASRQPE